MKNTLYRTHFEHLSLYLQLPETVVMKKNNAESEKDLSESVFSEYMQRGDDFYKIELLRQAVTWYSKALNMNNNDEVVKSRLSECKTLLRYENKVVYILLSIASVIVIAYFALIK